MLRAALPMNEEMSPMRAVGLSLGKTLALFTSASLVLASTPAFAADPSSSPAAPEATKEVSTGQKPETKDPAPPPVAETPKAEAAPAGTQPADGKVTIHLESPQQVTLEKRQGSSAPWEHVCNSPCDEAVSVSDEYHVIGVGLMDSKPFMLDPKESKVSLSVQPGKRNRYQTGEWILGGGGVLAVTGIVFIAAGAGTSNTFSNDGITHNSNTNWITAGMAFILGGIAVGIYGGATMIDNAHTTVNGAKASPEKQEPGAGASVKLSAKNEPTFVGPANRNLGAPPAAITIPFLSGSF